MNEFIIVFRECLEASLIVGIIYSFLSRSNLHDALKKLWLGVGASVIASIFVAVFVGIILIAMYLPMFSMMSTVG